MMLFLPTTSNIIQNVKETKPFSEDRKIQVHFGGQTAQIDDKACDVSKIENGPIRLKFSDCILQKRTPYDGFFLLDVNHLARKNHVNGTVLFVYSTVSSVRRIQQPLSMVDTRKSKLRTRTVQVLS